MCDFRSKLMIFITERTRCHLLNLNTFLSASIAAEFENV